MRQHLGLVLFLTVSAAQADVSGKWIGTAGLGPSKIAQTMDSDALLKLQMSKAFLKSIRYDIELKSDGTFVSIVTGADIDRRKSFGTWKEKGPMLTLTTNSENGAKVSRTMTANIDPKGSKWTIVVPSKPGLPITKLVFTKVIPPLPVKPPVSKGTEKPKSTQV